MLPVRQTLLLAATMVFTCHRADSAPVNEANELPEFRNASDFQSKLEIVPKTIAVIKGSEFNFQLKLSEAIVDDIEIQIECRGKKCEQIFGDSLRDVNATMTANYSGETEVKILPADTGHIVLLVRVSNLTIDTSQAFVEVLIGKSYGLSIFSDVIGWSYVVAWALSLHTQIWLNFKRKSVTGLSFDYLCLNLLGYSCYTIYNMCLYFGTVFQDAYSDRYPMSNIPIQLNDIGFSCHSIAATLVTICQCFCYERGSQNVSYATRAILSFVAIVGSILLALSFELYVNWLDFLYFFSYTKLLLTVFKYIPQAWFNYKRKKTSGWSIHGVLLDLTGGVLSVFQMVIIAYNYDDWISLYGNFTKLGLGLLTMIFDLIFAFQHYILYSHSSKPDKSRSLIK